jgi:hypothetical protein
MPGADPAVAFSKAATALNELTRLEEVRSDFTAENWEQLLAGLGTVITSAARLADCLGNHLAQASSKADWRTAPGPGREDPAKLLSATAESVELVSRQLTEVAGTIATSRDQVALLHLAVTKRRGEGPRPAADAEPG